MGCTVHHDITMGTVHVVSGVIGPDQRGRVVHVNGAEQWGGKLDAKLDQK